jgi:hypothetical protein
LQWYEEKQPGLAAKFLKELDYYLDLIAKNPLRFPVKFSDRYRFAVLKVFLLLYSESKKIKS